MRSSNQPHFYTETQLAASLQSSSYRHHIQSSEDIFNLARHLSKGFPNSQKLLIGIYELLLNAVEHGNLEIDSACKTQLLRNGMFAQEVTRRMALPHNQKKYIEVKWEKDSYSISLSIRDQGKGFNWRQCFEKNIDNCTIHGRGLLIAKQCGFDVIEFNETGNVVTCIVHHNQLQNHSLCLTI